MNEKMTTIKGVIVTQFFNYKGMKWSDLTTREHGVIPSVDRTAYLWSETPTIKEYAKDYKPLCGYILLIEGENDSIKLLKANYDTSD